MSSATQNSWEPVHKTRTYEQVMAQIERRILDGRLAPGDRLPSEREFAQLLGVSRPSLREALRVLEALGIVDVRPGRGPEGGTVFLGQPGTGLSMLLKMQLALGHFDRTEVLRTRLTLEEWAITEAARHATSADHHALREILDEMDGPELTTGDFHRLDTEFHVRIAESTGNSLAAHLMASLRTAIQRQMVEAHEPLEDRRVTSQRLHREHLALVQAIEDHDAERAVALLRGHINDFYRLDDVER
ncbi:FadR family transcriptional regulator [Saccharopolyspora rhizosphaerae]|uniref:FadR family transcriptional regulator n=1 Tax=Saccharopolyspora rhizosphaerae TaxID=2492662 RepID=A0A3R8NYP2_9PSEU|nr:FadR/GntR family transcriptional regulator [Saccharopolyspora rhizosphaerae]RRO12660.1 FadR family transcriptional regulator [Saccharopolyspora rhizosphaerae]